MIISTTIKAIRNWTFRQNLKMAIRQARYRQAKTFKRQVVFLMNGKLMITDRQQLKTLHREGKFKKGLSYKEIEAAALYTTKL